MQVKSNSLKDTTHIAKDFAKRLKSKGHALVLFDAEMGAGKTTFINEVVKNLCKNAKPTSPTFTIINQYSLKIFHIDLYRIKDQRELLNTDFYQIVAGENFTFIEWAEKWNIGESMAGATHPIRVKINVEEDGSRVFDITD